MITTCFEGLFKTQDFEFATSQVHRATRLQGRVFPASMGILTYIPMLLTTSRDVWFHGISTYKPAFIAVHFRSFQIPLTITAGEICLKAVHLGRNAGYLQVIWTAPGGCAKRSVTTTCRGGMGKARQLSIDRTTALYCMYAAYVSL